MSEYIDRGELLNIINKNVAEAHNERCAQLLEAILSAPTADVVEVVRCKDCKFATEYCHGDFDCQCPHTPWASDEYTIPCKANDFCTYGERREETK